MGGGRLSPLLCLKVHGAEGIYQKLLRAGVRIVEELHRRKTYQYFRIMDPSGNLIEIFEAVSSLSIAS